MEINSFVPKYTPKNVKDTEMSEADKKKLKAVSKEMEAEFLKIMMKAMKRRLNSAELTEKAPGKDIMTAFMIERYAEETAKNELLGIAKMIYEQYTKEYKK